MCSMKEHQKQKGLCRMTALTQNPLYTCPSKLFSCSQISFTTGKKQKQNQKQLTKTPLQNKSIYHLVVSWKEVLNIDLKYKNLLGNIFISIRTLNKAKKIHYSLVSEGSRNFKHLELWTIKDILVLSDFLWVGISASGPSEEKSNPCETFVKNFPGVPVITLIWIVVKIKLSNTYKFHKSKSDAPHSYNNISDTESGN